MRNWGEKSLLECCQGAATGSVLSARLHPLKWLFLCSSLQLVLGLERMQRKEWWAGGQRISADPAAGDSEHPHDNWISELHCVLLPWIYHHWIRLLRFLHSVAVDPARDVTWLSATWVFTSCWEVCWYLTCKLQLSSRRKDHAASRVLEHKSCFVSFPPDGVGWTEYGHLDVRDIG